MSRVTISNIILTSMLALLILSVCFCTSPMAGKSIAFEQITDGISSCSENRSTTVIKTQNELDRWWDENVHHESNPPDVDFSKKMLVALTCVCSSSSIDFELESARFDNLGRLELTVAYIDRGVGMAVIFNLFKVYAIDRTDALVKWTAVEIDL